MEVYDYRVKSEAHLRLEGDKIYWNQWLRGEHPTLPAPIGIFVKEPVHD